MSVKIT